MDNIIKLSKDLKQASSTLSKAEARFLVDAYYIWQENRKRSDNQVRALEETGEPHSVLAWLAENDRLLENELKKALQVFAESHPAGVWAMSQVGVGPVISAGLLAHIDMSKAPSAAHVWAYAGLVPGQRRERGQKINWNPDLKRLAFIIGDCFCKVSNKEDAFYGHLYKQRKEYEAAKNEKLEYADQARAALERKKYDKNTEAYKAYIEGKLPLKQLHNRAARYAAKMFLSHFWYVSYHYEHGKEPPKPYALAHLDHVDFIKPPKFEPYVLSKNHGT